MSDGRELQRQLAQVRNPVIPDRRPGWNRTGDPAKPDGDPGTGRWPCRVVPLTCCWWSEGAWRSPPLGEIEIWNGDPQRNFEAVVDVGNP